MSQKYRNNSEQTTIVGDNRIPLQDESQTSYYNFTVYEDYRIYLMLGSFSQPL